MSFGVDLRAFRDRTSARVNAVVRKIILDVGVRLVERSPVGDADYWAMPAPPGYVGGRFRANWQYGLNSPDVATTENTDASGAATISGIERGIDGKVVGRVHYITNSLPYSKRLEEGWSRQAPNGMVRLTTIEFRPIVAAAARALNNG